MSASNLPERARGELASAAGVALPKLIAAAGDEAAHHFLNFFIASIRNRHTRRAYARQATAFLAWCAAKGASDVRGLRTPHAAAYIETLTRSELQTASVKESLAALRHLFDWLTVHHVVASNPFAAVRGPKLVVAEGHTPLSTPAEK